MSLPDPRVVTATIQGSKKSTTVKYLANVPAQLHVCRESRSIALGKYSLQFSTQDTHPVYVESDKDWILASSVQALELTMALHPKDLQRVRRIAVQPFQTTQRHDNPFVAQHHDSPFVASRKILHVLQNTWHDEGPERVLLVTAAGCRANESWIYLNKCRNSLAEGIFEASDTSSWPVKGCPRVVALFCNGEEEYTLDSANRICTKMLVVEPTCALGVLRWARQHLQPGFLRRLASMTEKEARKYGA